MSAPKHLSDNKMRINYEIMVEAGKVILNAHRQLADKAESVGLNEEEKKQLKEVLEAIQVLDKYFGNIPTSIPDLIVKIKNWSS